ncbi:MAG: DUF362 domain-containing protein [Candidatus Aenigmatarchaeota archaeon]
MSEVYLWETDADSIDPEELVEKLKPFLDKLPEEERVALKLHVGERNSDTHLKPDWIEPIYSFVDERNKDCALMDCTVLYNSPRALASSHREVARDNGFDFAPMVIADGEKGREETEAKIDGEIFDSVKIGKALEDYGSLLVVSHLTGHLAAGFGGALKNVGMGLGSKAGKMEMHQTFELKVNGRKCVACGKCVENCPEGAISIKSSKLPRTSKSASIDHEKCIGCGGCIAVCPEGAVKIPWSSASRKELQKRIAEYALGVLKDKNSVFVNFLLNITKKCDCVNEKQNSMTEDIGVLVSEDPVAIDQASLDLVGKSKLMLKEMMVSPDLQVKHAEKIGLGEREYELKKLLNK